MSPALLWSGTPEMCWGTGHSGLGNGALQAAGSVHGWVLQAWSFPGPFGRVCATRVTLLFLLNDYFLNFYVSE